MYPAMNLGPLVLPTAALVYLLGLWVLLYLHRSRARLLDLDPEALSGWSPRG